MINSDLAKIREAFTNEFPQKVILQITDYREKGIYVVSAINKSDLDSRDEMLDCLFAVDMNNFKIYGFNPLAHNPQIYFSLKPNRIIFKRP